MILSNINRKQTTTPQRHSSLGYIAAIMVVLVLLILICCVLDSGSEAAESTHENQTPVTETYADNEAEQAVNTADAFAAELFAGTYEYESDAESAFKSCLRSALLSYTLGEDLARQYDISSGSDTTTATCNNELGYMLGVKAPRGEELSKKALARYAACYQPIYQTDDINVYIVIDRVCDALEDGKLTF